MAYTIAIPPKNGAPQSRTCGTQISTIFSIFEPVNKLIAILVLGMYSLGLSGLGVSYHFCGNTFMYAELVAQDHADEKGCRESCCGKKSDRCCKDKQVKLVIKEHKQTISKLVLQPFSFDDINLPAPVAAAQVFHTQYDAAGDFRLRPPPLRTGGRPLYMLHSVYRI